MHLTLKFLGEVDPSRRGEIAASLKEAAGTVRPFKLTSGGLGGFPDLKRPRVLWVGLKESEELKRLYKEIDSGLGSIGFKKDCRPFSPHLTICRLKTREARIAAARAISATVAEGMAGLTGTSLSMDFEVDSFVLFKSVLSPRGAEHVALESIRLAG